MATTFPLSRFQRVGATSTQLAALQTWWNNLTAAQQLAELNVIQSETDGYVAALVAAGYDNSPTAGGAVPQTQLKWAPFTIYTGPTTVEYLGVVYSVPAGVVYTSGATFSSASLVALLDQTTGVGLKSWRRDGLPSRAVVRQVMPSASAPTVTFGADNRSIPYNKSFDGFSGYDIAISGYRNGVKGPLVTPRGAPLAAWTSEATDGSGAYYCLGCRAPDAGGYTGPAWEALEFLTDAPQVEISLEATGGVLEYRVWVDDLVVGSLIPVSETTSAGTVYSVLIDFSSVGGSKPRKIMLEQAFARFHIIGITVPSGYTDSPYTISPAPEHGPSAIWVGDSLIQGGTADSTSAIYQISSIVQELLGWRIDNMGIGGSGYISTAGGNNNAGPAQATAIAAGHYAGTNPDFIICTLGHNDSSAQTAAITSAVQSMVATFQAAFPRAQLIFSGPLGVQASALASYQAKETAIFAGLPSTALWIPQWNGVAPWVTGTGNTSTPTHDGNADFYIGPDGVHWTDAGIAYMGERFAREIQKLVGTGV